MDRSTTLIFASLALAVLHAQDAPPPSPPYRPVSLSEASARIQPDFKPKLNLEMVRVRGITISSLLEASDATYLAIADPEEPSHGLLLLYSGDNKERKPDPSTVPAGTIVEVDGIVSLHAGQAVVKPIDIRVVGKQEVPNPPVLTPVSAASFEHEGLVVVVEGEVNEFREGSWGDLLDFKEGGRAIQVFLPLPNRGMERPLSVYKRGDHIRVKGLVTQFCLRPPYNQYFQLMLANARDIELTDARPAVPPQIVPAAVLLVLIGITAAWYVQQRTKWQQKLIHRFMQASEEIYSLGTAREVAEMLRSSLMELLPVESVSTYHYDPARKVFDRIPDQASSAPHSFHIEECSTSLEHAIAKSVRERNLISASDTSSLDSPPPANETPHALLVLPMKSRSESRGAIVLTAPVGKQILAEAILLAAQHLANDACQYFESLEQTALREQQHRSDKLAVAGQLIHGVITELNTPLEQIRELTAALPESEAAAIHAQVKKASETVRRVVAVARAEQIDARPVDLRFLLQRLMEDFEEGLREGNIEADINLGPESLFVLGSQEQLLQVFENLLLHAKAAAIHSLEHVFTLNLNRIGRSAMIEVEFSGPFAEGEGPDFSGAALGLAITRGLLQSYGGELRFKTIRAGRFRYDIELPSLNASPAEDFATAITLSPQRGLVTALLVEPDFQTQRKMLAIFGELSHRLIPVGNVEEATDLAEKVRFDIVFASSRPEGGSWADLFHRIHHRTPHFVLLSESAEEPIGDVLEGTASSVLRKPIEEADIIGLLDRLHQRS
ncbi:MAG: HAMP domain-containing histidine kinase [Acidobacteria bacterium]|nr:HAMP domain-containing histidine kinase [Acidobacteriota bacterium]